MESDCLDVTKVTEHKHKQTNSWTDKPINESEERTAADTSQASVDQNYVPPKW